MPTPLIVAHAQLATRMATGELANVIAEGGDDAVQGRFRWFLKMLEVEVQQLSTPPQSAIEMPIDPTAQPILPLEQAPVAPPTEPAMQMALSPADLMVAGAPMPLLPATTPEMPLP